MDTRCLRVAAVLASLAVLAGCQIPRATAPPFQGRATDGQNYSMLDVTRAKPLLVVFAEAKDPKPLEQVAKLKAAAGDKFEAVGVIVIPALNLEKFAQQFPDVIPTIADPDNLIGVKYSVETRPAFFWIEVGGHQKGMWQGLTDQTKQEISEKIGVPVSAWGQP